MAFELSDIFGTNKEGTSAGLGGLLGGIGALAGAWGKYSSNKKQNKLLSAQFDYEKQKDALANNRFVEDRAAINDAFGIVPKKKKTDVVDPMALNTYLGA